MVRFLSQLRQVGCSLRSLRSSSRNKKFKRPDAFFQMGFSTLNTGGLEDEKEKTLHFTASCVHGIMMNSKNAGKLGGVETLGSLFENSPRRCFVNYRSVTGNHDFSNFIKDILAQVLIVLYQQSTLNGRRFRLDPDSILVYTLDNVILDVAIPKTQVLDPKETSIYKDEIVGPFAAMAFSLCLTQSNTDPITGGKSASQCYKEIYDLLLRAKTGRWWTSLGELLRHPLFWTLEEKAAILVFFNMWIAKTATGPDHDVPGVPLYVRKRNKYPEGFLLELEKHLFYQRDYSFQELSAGEVDVTEITNSKKCWKDVMRQAKCFGSGYFLGKIHDPSKLYLGNRDMIRQCRVMVVHFLDTNMNAFAIVLDKPTMEVAIIYLDKNFSMSLSAFHTLKKMNIDVVNLFANDL